MPSRMMVGDIKASAGPQVLIFANTNPNSPQAAVERTRWAGASGLSRTRPSVCPELLRELFRYRSGRFLQGGNVLRSAELAHGGAQFVQPCHRHRSAVGERGD